METVTNVFGQRVRWARSKNGLSQARLAELATDLGQPIDNTVVSRIEAGRRGVSMGEFFVLSALLGMRLEEAVTPLDPTVARIALGDGEASQSAPVSSLVEWIQGASSMFGDVFVSDPPRTRESGAAHLLRALATECERVTSAAGELEVVEAGLDVLRGAAATLKISARREAKGGA